MKPAAQALATLIVTLFNTLWSRVQQSISDSTTQLQSWANDTFVKIGDAVDSNTVGGQTAAQIKSDALTAAALLVKNATDALRSRIADFALVQLSEGQNYSFPAIVGAELGAPDDLDNGAYQLKFIGAAGVSSTLINIPNIGNVPTNQEVTNGDTVLFTVLNGVVTSVEFYNDLTNLVIQEHGDRITDLEAGAVTTNQNLQVLIDAAITSTDFEGMKAYIESNVVFYPQLIP
jgi:hypothetical protein